MSDIEEPPLKVLKLQDENGVVESLDPEAEDSMEDGQEEWLSEGVLTDDDYNPGAENETLDSNAAEFGNESRISREDASQSHDDSMEQLDNTIKEEWNNLQKQNDQEIKYQDLEAHSTTQEADQTPGDDAQQSDNRTQSIDDQFQGNEAQTQETDLKHAIKSEVENIEETLNNFDGKTELPDDLNAFLVRKVKTESQPEKKEPEDDGNDTDELLNAMPKIRVRDIETLKYKISVRRRGKTSTERSREFRERKKTLQSAASQELNISSSIITKTLKNKISVRRPGKTSTERSREFRERKKTLQSAASQELNISSSIITKTLKNKMSVRRRGKTSTERSREFRERKKALKSAASQELNIPSSIITKTPAERSREYRARKRQKYEQNQESNDLTRSTVEVEVHQEQENSQPSTLPIKKPKTSSERVREFRARKKIIDKPFRKH